ncbi:Defensin SD2 [Capsicum annuum]|uniref:Defensin SD2 n=1 Tax=Capsicum annuum TaxID=4072 RepID=A0A2G2ZH52_CAPAN|nr:defensin J1-2-like [Capsicum annuum]KAF3650437.1 Defensin SD2 [Capsicum annuum]PHT81264.1 Defensin SD2 [Capsicum annuum]
MAGFKKLLATIFLVLMLVFASEMAEARKCESQSHRFKGPCVRKSNCASVCQTEGFTGGHCRGFRRRCFCTKHC